MKKIVYIDLDGVVADFEKHYELLYGNIADKDALKENKKNFAKDRFFINLPVIPAGIELLKYVASFDVEVRILTAVGDNDVNFNRDSKRIWVAAKLGDYGFDWVKKAHEKAKYASDNVFLFDDRPKSLDPFLDAGGVGFLFDASKLEAAKLAFNEFIK